MQFSFRQLLDIISLNAYPVRGLAHRFSLSCLLSLMLGGYKKLLDTLAAYRIHNQEIAMSYRGSDTYGMHEPSGTIFLDRYKVQF
jgi:hypothetical protein